MKELKRVYLVDKPEFKQQLIDLTSTSIPHTKALGIEVISMERNIAIGMLPYSKSLVGNIENGALHTGVLISLVDTISGLAVFSALPEVEEFATLDLRLDCFKPSVPMKDVYARVECHRLTNTIAFVRGSIYHDTPSESIAACVATFFRTGNQTQLHNSTGRKQ